MLLDPVVEPRGADTSITPTTEGNSSSRSVRRKLSGRENSLSPGVVFFSEGEGSTEDRSVKEVLLDELSPPTINSNLVEEEDSDFIDWLIEDIKDHQI